MLLLNIVSSSSFLCVGKDHVLNMDGLVWVNATSSDPNANGTNWVQNTDGLDVCSFVCSCCIALTNGCRRGAQTTSLWKTSTTLAETTVSHSKETLPMSM